MSRALDLLPCHPKQKKELRFVCGVVVRVRDTQTDGLRFESGDIGH